MNTPEVIELNNQRLLTTDQLAEFYGTTSARITQNFGYNKEKFTEGKHYYRLEGDELKAFKSQVGNSDLPINKFVSQLILYTKQGASRHSKMLGTDEAWDMYDQLEENCFNPRPVQLPTDPRSQLKLMYEFSEQTAERVDAVEKDIIDLRDNQVINTADYNHISTRVSQRVAQVAKSFGKITAKQRTELFRDINGGVKRITGVGSRSQLRSKHYDAVIEFIQDWEPSTATKSIVRQMSLDLEEH